MMIAPKALLIGYAVIAASVSCLQALTLTSIDFTPLGTSDWSQSFVRLNFGEDAGMGTVIFQSVNGGSASILTAGAAYNAAPYSSYGGPTMLDTGDLFNPAEEVVFRLQPGPEPGLSGVTMTVFLDGGAFPNGSLFSARSFGRDGSGGYQTMNVISGLGLVDPVHLPSDDVWGPPPALVETSPGSGQFQAATTGSNSTGRAFGITGGFFSVSFLATEGYIGGGEAFTIAIPAGAAVPEPSCLVLGLAALGVLGAGRRRWRDHPSG